MYSYMKVKEVKIQIRTMSPTRLSADEDYLFNSFEDSSKVNGIDCCASKPT